MIFSMKTQNINNDLKKSEDIFDFSNLDERYYLFGKKIKKVIGKFKIETRKKIWLDEFLCLRSKACSSKCKDNIESKSQMKIVSKSQSNILNLKKITTVYLVENIEENVLITFFVQLTMKSIFKKENNIIYFRW